MQNICQVYINFQNKIRFLSFVYAMRITTHTSHTKLFADLTMMMTASHECVHSSSAIVYLRFNESIYLLLFMHEHYIDFMLIN